VSTLAKAFRGERVPQNPNDETASELLERIRKEQAKKQPKRKTTLEAKALRKSF
jgi:type I restriction enzyme S subunit